MFLDQPGLTQGLILPSLHVSKFNQVPKTVNQPGFSFNLALDLTWLYPRPFSFSLPALRVSKITQAPKTKSQPT